MRVATVVGAVTVLWILAGLDRRYNRWERRLRSDISPLTRPRARMERVRVGIRDQRDVFGDLALLVSTVMQEVEAA